MFRSDSPVMTTYSNKFLAEKHHIQVMELWLNGKGDGEPKKVKESVKAGRAASSAWVIRSAAGICAREASFVTDRASYGPFKEEAASLRVPASRVTVETVRSFRVANLLATYEHTLPRLQEILKAVIGKEGKPLVEGSRDPAHGRTLATSILLNLRSRQTNYHACMNTLFGWDNRVPKRFISAMNHYGVTSSYEYQCRAILSLSEDSITQARAAANDPAKIKLLPYDNFNWVIKTYEASALHGSVQHDQVSALLVIIPPVGEGVEGMSAAEIMNVESLRPTESKRHDLPPRKSLTDILPSLEDHNKFRQNAILHVARILVEEIPSLKDFAPQIPLFTDPKAIPTQKTEEYYLPTFDQEQGSTRGNMIVLEHYFTKVLCIPKSTFETTMHTVLGDRLTTVRDRAAQDQRAVDMSKDRFDHLSLFAMISGLMHYELNYVQAVGGVFWGSTAADDPLSLSNIRDQLPNRTDVQLSKVNYYAWLCFLDAILHALVLQASIATSSLNSYTDLQKRTFNSIEDLLGHAGQIVDSFLAQSPGRLEAMGVKKIPANTVSSNAVFLFYNLMLLREMRSGVKLGHIGRVIRMLKFWLPIFYAAGSYNYANETMELLHNLEHDWPKPFATVNANGMLVNPHGRDGDWKPTDIRVEHLNDRVKEHAHGSNASPAVLEKVTPAMGHVQEYTDQLLEELGVEAQNQKHAHVRQQRDVQLLVDYFSKHNVFNFNKDKSTAGNFFDLFTEGTRRLSGPTGGHAKHLARHALRLRTRHQDPSHADIPDELSQNPDAYQELEVAKDSNLEAVQRSGTDSAADIITLEEIVQVGMEYRDDDINDIEG
ncbi:hypothetical protein EST38_g13409 [Candolleomyces aberdarensis]|uniref:DUF6589 domain-containing protein n=1 Tax=Candolleomyces aberdarensis TaxID=2316362 RepID=A0A4Q2D2A6_9AGAR|nr:hypothetical protein EST38_g13409 [Candolleomyces aberdarensis]